MNYVWFILILISCFLGISIANDVLGCGGFVKSHVQIDFSKVVVKLYTKHGILKDKTNCAPNNGYYFIPLYDKGDYVLKLEPPAGWSFNPTEIQLNVDGQIDLCSQGKDINFVFKGFGITGKVESSGSNEGPSGVIVELKSESETRLTTTTTGGDFFFTPVYPGLYKVSISHSRWQIAKGQVDVRVQEGNTELRAKSLIIKGYDVTGYVKSEGEPVENVHLILSLHASNKGKFEVEGCSKTPLKDYKSSMVCHVISNKDGLFTFPCISPGKYVIVPFLQGQNIHFQPSLLEFEVGHDSVILPEAFEIVGFSISGKVLDSPNGRPLSGAKVYLNKRQIAVTKSDGIYLLEKVRAGLYKLHVEADNLKFEEITAKINPTDRALPDLTPSKYYVCGTVISDKSHTVTIGHIGTPQSIVTSTDPVTGIFCEFLSPGKYKIYVSVSELDHVQGLQFYPVSHVIDVNAGTTSGIVFSQLKATVSGKIQCISANDCEKLKIIMRAVVRDGQGEENEIVVDVISNEYKVSDVRPGNYEIWLAPTRLCWKESKHVITVNNDTAQVPPFVQSGYLVYLISSHDTKLKYKLANENSYASVDVTRGRMTYCLPRPGSYEFTLEGCHFYESDLFTYDTSNESNELHFVAQKHLTKLAVDGPDGVPDITMTVNIEGVKSQHGPLKYISGSYSLELVLSPGENVVLVPHSDIVFFKPPIVSVTGEDDCTDLKTVFKGVKGRVFQGKVVPTLPGVLITLETEKEALIEETDVEGRYKFPPQDDSKTYRIFAKKDSFILVGPDEKGDFLAHKLAEIVVQVFDEDTGLPLQGALLSLSGGESYRSNLQTNQDGKITFNSLSPSEYFLRPMMKEYSFEPASKMIDVREGETVNLKLKGKRVAYSVFGQITSLNGDAENDMMIIASGTGNCSMFSEESMIESNGKFRVRGLQPHCQYIIRAEKTTSGKQPIERVIPPSTTITDVNQDIIGLKFIVFRHITNSDILLKVYAKDPEHYKTLRVKVSRESPPSAVLHTTRLDVSNYKLTKDNNNGVLVQIPSIPLDGKTYAVQIESNLPQNIQEKLYVQSFTSNSTFKYLEFEYVVKTITGEQHMKQTSVWTLVGIFTLIFLIYNTEHLYNMLRQKLSKLNVSGVVSNIRQKQLPIDTVDANDIDQLVESINAVKRKPKPKKI